MTPKEWAAKAMDALDQNSPDCSVSETITLYIEKAVEEERERCADVAFEQLSLGGPGQYALADEVAGRIRQLPK
jgi:hypothetical protein